MYSSVNDLSEDDLYGPTQVRKPSQNNKWLITCTCAISCIIYFIFPVADSYGSTLAGMRGRIPQGEWKFVSCGCCVLSGRGLCFGLISRPQESYQMWCVWVLSCSLDNEEALAL